MLKTFRIGGIHPKENKLTSQCPVTAIPVPRQVSLMLNQHIGAPANCIVKKGDTVKVGTLIAEANGFVSSNIHSPVSGTVSKIDKIANAFGIYSQAIIIDTEGDDWEEYIDRTPSLEKEIALSSNEIIQKIAQNGIVGLGGATFPTHVKLTPPKEFKPTVLIVNATECEPYLTDDHALMLESPEQIIIGCHILMKAIHVKQAYIGVENNKRDAIALLKKQTEKYPGIEIVPLRTRYPQGGEKQLIDAILHKQVANGALPVSTGAIVQNVGTAFAVYEAVQKNKPLVERIVTVTGDGIKQPGNYRIRLGMPIRELIEIAGGLPSDSAKVILGGPMMGKAVSNLDAPIPKGCSGILILNEAHAHRSETSSCIRCGKCVSACPMGLEPYLLAKLSENHLFEKAEKDLITACLECGCCAYSCPSNRPILKEKPSIGNGSAILTGLLLAFNLPSNLPIWIVVIGSIVAIGIAKMSFGGLGNNLFNPALAGRVFLLISFPTQMTQWPLPIVSRWNYTDAETGATLLSKLKEEGGQWIEQIDIANLWIGNQGGSLSWHAGKKQAIRKIYPCGNMHSTLPSFSYCPAGFC